MVNIKIACGCLGVLDHPFHEWNGNEGGLVPYVE